MIDQTMPADGPGSFEKMAFVGGPYDGSQLPVPQPVDQGLELRVRSLDPLEGSASYVLGEDGQFHHLNEASLPAFQPTDGDLTR